MCEKRLPLVYMLECPVRKNCPFIVNIDESKRTDSREIELHILKNYSAIDLGSIPPPISILRNCKSVGIRALLSKPFL